MLRIFNQYYPLRNIAFCFFEGVFILVSVVAATFVRFGGDIRALFAYEHIILKALLVTVICQLCLYFNELYDFRVTNSNLELGIRLLQAIGISYLVIALVYFFFPVVILGRGIFLINLFFLIGFIVSWRLAYNWVLRTSKFDQRVLIVGTGDLSKKLTYEIASKKDSGFRVAGFISNDPKMMGEKVANLPVMGDYCNILDAVKKEEITKVVIALNERRGNFPTEALLGCKMMGIEVEEGTSFFERLSGKILVDSINPGWLIFSEGFKKSRIKKTIKRLSGVIISAVGLILLSPLILITAILIRIDSPGTVFFSQERVGEGGKVFSILKFRSMVQDAEGEGEAIWAKENDSRITRVGRIIRKLRIDEIPQMFNVLKGEMSFVGPRPERPEFVKGLKKEIPYYSQRHTVKPGITGWAQIMYPYGSSIEDAKEKLQYDLYYAKNMSTLLDLMIIFMTIKVILLRKGSR